MLTFAMLNRRWPNASHALVQGVSDNAAANFAKYGLTSLTEQADILAQVSEETGGGTATEENLNYTAQRLCAVWPSLFPSLAAAMPYAHNPKALADKAYGGRGGNVPGTDDGWNFRGRGAMQTTFRNNYAMTAKITSLDCLNNPDLVCDPAHFLECACAFWKNANLNPIADAGNFNLETLRLNGGYTNLALREQWRSIWREELGAASPAAPGASAVGSMAWVQGKLNATGASPQLIVDGVSGEATKNSIMKFQAAQHLAVDGIIGSATIDALAAH